MHTDIHTHTHTHTCYTLFKSYETLTPCTLVERNLLPLLSVQPLVSTQAAVSPKILATIHHITHVTLQTTILLWQHHISVLHLIHLTPFGVLLLGVTTSWYWKCISGDAAIHTPQGYTSLLRYYTDISVHMAEVKEIRPHTLPVRTFCSNPTPPHRSRKCKGHV